MRHLALPPSTLLLSCLSLLFACGDGSSDDTGATTLPPPITSATEGTTNPGSTDPATAGSVDETAGPQPLDRTPCDRVEQCLFDTEEAVTAFLAVYGESGTCWEEFPAEACRQDCRALLDPLHGSHCDDTPSCCHCQESADCSDEGEGALCTASNECADESDTCQLVAPEYAECTRYDTPWLGLCENVSSNCTAPAAAFTDCVWECLSDDSCTTFDVCGEFVEAVELAYTCVDKGYWPDCELYETVIGTCATELYALASC